MAQRSPAGETPERYEIRVRGHLDPHWAAWFDGLTLTHTIDGSTVLEGPIQDQAALHGVLRKLADMGMALLSVAQLLPNVATPTLPDHSEGDRHDH